MQILTKTIPIRKVGELTKQFCKKIVTKQIFQKLLFHTKKIKRGIMILTGFHLDISLTADVTWSS